MLTITIYQFNFSFKQILLYEKNGAMGKTGKKGW